MMAQENWIGIEKDQNHVLFTIKTGNLRLFWPRLILFVIAAGVFLWGLDFSYGQYGPGTTFVKFIVLPISFFFGMAALIQGIPLLAFYLFQKRTTNLGVSRDGLAVGKLVVPFDGLTSLFIGNKKGDKIEGRVIATPGAELESKMADQTYSLNVNTRGIEKRIVKSLNWHQAKYLLSEVEKAIKKVST